MALKLKSPIKFQGRKLTVNKIIKVPVGAIRNRANEYILDRTGNYIQKRNQQ